MGTDGPSIDAEAERQEGEEETVKIGGGKETRDVMRDAPEIVRKKWRARMEPKKIIEKKTHSCVCLADTEIVDKNVR